MVIKKGGDYKMVKKFFKPKEHTGWHKGQSANTRRSLLLKAADNRKTLKGRRLEAGRKALALANITKDKLTRIAAKSDALYFFRLLKK